MVFLTKEERKQRITHICNYFTFTSCMDLSCGIIAIPNNNDEKYLNASHLIAKDVASFTCWWLLNIKPQLNGFSGLDTINWEFKLEG